MGLPQRNLQTSSRGDVRLARMRVLVAAFRDRACRRIPAPEPPRERRFSVTAASHGTRC
jgi:hypothetical protein